MLEIQSIPVTTDNRDQITALQLLPEQQGYIEPVEQCLEEAGQFRNWRPVGLYDGGTLIGFAMYGWFFWEYFPRGRLWLDRFLIDRRYQGRGYGRAALRHMLDRLVLEHWGKDVYLSVIPGNGGAVRLYEGAGFRFIGEKDVHGEDVMRLRWAQRNSGKTHGSP